MQQNSNVGDSRQAASSDVAGERADQDPFPERPRAARSGRSRLSRARRLGLTRRLFTPAADSLSGPARPTASLFASRLLALALGVALLTAALSLPLAQESVSMPSGGAPVPPTAPSLSLDRLLWAALLVGFLIALGAFFAMAEIALITVRKTRIRQLVEEGNRSAQLVEAMLANPTRLTATIQTGVTLVTTLSIAIAALSAVGPLSAWLRAQGGAALAPYAGLIALFAVTLPVAALLLVFGQIAPKSLAFLYAERLALLSVYPIRALQLLLTPVIASLTFLSNLVVRPFGGTVSFTQPVVNEEELKMLVEASEEQGVLEADETEMIHSILNFGDTVARKVMTPRIDLSAAEVNTPLPELARLVYESGHSRIPVYEENLDNIVGIVHAKDLLPLLIGPDQVEISIRSVMRPPYFIPETKKVDELLAEFQRSKQQIAIVSDEYGVTSGLVTIEDLLEEIVGDIQDEYDQEEPPALVVDGSTTILDGRMSLADVNDRMGLNLPEDEADTIGGFVFGRLGHQAQQGEKAVWEGVEFHVEATDGRRIQKVRIVRTTSPSADLLEPKHDAPRNGMSVATSERNRVGSRP